MAEAIEECCLWAYSPYSLIESRSTSLGLVLPTRDWSLSHQSLMKKMPYRQILWRHFLNLVF